MTRKAEKPATCGEVSWHDPANVTCTYPPGHDFVDVETESGTFERFDHGDRTTGVHWNDVDVERHHYHGELEVTAEFDVVRLDLDEAANLAIESLEFAHDDALAAIAELYERSRDEVLRFTLTSPAEVTT